MYAFPRGRDWGLDWEKADSLPCAGKTGGRSARPRERMNLRNLREVDTALAGMVYLMRRAVTTRDDGSYAYAGRAGFALLTRHRSRDPATG